MIARLVAWFTHYERPHGDGVVAVVIPAGYTGTHPAWWGGR